MRYLTSENPVFNFPAIVVSYQLDWWSLNERKIWINVEKVDSP